MDKNTITGLLLIGLILVGYSLWMQPSEAELEASRKQQDSVETVQASKAAEQIENQNAVVSSIDSTSSLSMATDSVEQALRDSLARIEKKRQFGSLAQATEGKVEFHTIENDFVKLTLSNKGAAPIQAG